jgi:hypothetical protein
MMREGFPPGLKAEPDLDLKNSFGATAVDNQIVPSEYIETEFQNYHSLLIQLLGIIPHGEDKDVSSMISFIRSGASDRQIFDFIKDQPR